MHIIHTHTHIHTCTHAEWLDLSAFLWHSICPLVTSDSADPRLTPEKFPLSAPLYDGQWYSYRETTAMHCVNGPSFTIRAFPGGDNNIKELLFGECLHIAIAGQDSNCIKWEGLFMCRAYTMYHTVPY